MRKTAFWLGPNEAVLMLVLLLLIIGSVNIFSASFVLGGQLMHDSYYFIKRHLVSLVAGIIGCVLFARMGYRRVAGFTPLLILMTIGLLISVHFFGVDANGARRWIKLFIQFQPSEFAKLTVIILTAVYLGVRLDRRRPTTLLSWPLGVTLLISGFVLKQPDMGTASIILGLCLGMYVIAGIPGKEVAWLGILATGLGIYFVFAAAYRAERVWAWLDPWNYQQSTGYQAVQSLLAIGSGGLLGSGYGKGASKFYYLPEAHTDFAFAVLCQEMGFIGAVVVLALLAALGVYGVKIAIGAKDGLGRMLATGIVLLILGQATGNIAMVSGIFPVTGIPLPFISYGGTSLITNLWALGILFSVGRNQAAAGTLETEPEPVQPVRRRLTLVPKN